MDEKTPSASRHQGLRLAAILASVLICAAAIAILVRDLQSLSLPAIAAAIAGMPPRRIVLCLLLTAASFAALGTYDVLAVRVAAPDRVPATLAWLAGAAGNAVSNTLGFHAVTGPMVRYRLYRGAGLGLADIAKVMSLSWATLGFGFATVLAASLLLYPGGTQGQRLVGILLVTALALLLRWLAPAGRCIRFAGISLPLPSASIAAAQMALGAVEMAAAVAALYVLMPDGAVPSFPAFSALYIGAVLLGIISHAPGGIGVFEAAMLTAANGQDRAALVAALLLYRLLYNFLPFAAALLAIGGFILARRRPQLDRG